MKHTSLERWQDRIGRAAALIETRLDDPPSLGELAGAAAVSPFHLHRIWRALTGETVSQTVNRLRIEASQAMLEGGATSVTDAAMATGFGTPQSFARLFRRHIGITPSAYAADPSRGIDQEPENTPIRLVLRAPLSVVALRREGGDYVALNAMFQRLWDWAEDADALADLEGLYGIPFDDPASVPEAALRYTACLALGTVDPPLPFDTIDLPAGRHALLRHQGSYDALPDVTQRLIGWLIASGHEPADAPIYHYFHHDPEQTPEADLVADILLPLAAREDPA